MFFITGRVVARHRHRPWCRLERPVRPTACRTFATSPELQRGAVRFEGSQLLRYEVATSSKSFHGSSTARGTAADEWGFLWGHGLASSMRSESEGGWPFADVVGLSDLMPVARYDARGHGTSDMSDQAHTWPAMGSDMAKLQKTWGRRRTVLGGTSMGCAASIYAVLEGRVDAAGLILATPPTCHERRQQFIPMYQESLELHRTQGFEAAYRVAASKTRPPIFLESEFGTAMFDVGWKEKYRMGMERYCAVMEGACASDLPSVDVLTQIRIPTLILAWKTDVQHPLETAEMLHEAIPDSQLFIARSWDEVETFSMKMRTFMNELMARA